MTARISRRTVLRGVGTAMALPVLETMSAVATAAPTPAPKQILRTAFMYVPNGIHMQDWTPDAEGSNFKLPFILEPLAPFQDSMTVFSGLTLDKARPNGDGAGDHARAMAAFLTGRQPRKTNGADIRVGQSADQWITAHTGDATKFGSLELGIERGLQSGNCDSGYSCAYQSNFSWRAESTPNAKEIDPKLVFERLFGNGSSAEMDAARAKRDLYNKSILDLVAEDAKSLDKVLAANDKRKVDEYFTAIRELEQRIEKTRMIKNTKTTFRPNIPAPQGIPKDFQEHLRIMCDLMVLAFQADLTRTVTFPFCNDGSNRNYSMIGVNDGHHDLSHHGGDKSKHEKIRKINRFHIEQLAYLLKRLQTVQENGKSILDTCMMVYGSGISDGDRHNHDNLPVLLLGKGAGKIKTTGKHIKVAKETPLMNLYLGIFDKLGCPAKSFGDSTGVLSI